jgi:Tfp pilus assembly protein PilF
LLFVEPLMNLWYNIGAIAHKLGWKQETEKFYQKALELNPQFKKAWNNLGVFMWEQKRFEKAEAAFLLPFKIHF